MKITRAVERTDEGQADCFWHDHSCSLRYVLVLQGVVPKLKPGPTPNHVSQVHGRVTSQSDPYDYMEIEEPQMLPNEVGPFTVLLVL